MIQQQPNSVPEVEAAAQFAEIMRRVRSGEQITITDHGVAVARIVPTEPVVLNEEEARARRVAAVKEIRELSKGQSLGGLKIKDLVNEGRP